jgi:hypothetical protein
MGGEVREMRKKLLDRVKSWFVRERVVYVPVSGSRKDMTDQAVNDQIRSLVDSHYWDLFEQVLWELHDRKTKELVGCKTLEDMHYIRGSIAVLNMLLTFKAVRKSL